jgi:hypothetical protein
MGWPEFSFRHSNQSAFPKRLVKNKAIRIAKSDHEEVKSSKKNEYQDKNQDRPGSDRAGVTQC